MTHSTPRPTPRIEFDVCSGPSLSRAERLAQQTARPKPTTQDDEQPVPTPRAIAAE